MTRVSMSARNIFREDVGVSRGRRNNYRGTLLRAPAWLKALHIFREGVEALPYG